MPLDMAMVSLLTQLEFPTATDHPRELMASVMLMPLDTALDMESQLTRLEFPTATGHLRVPMASGMLMPSDMLWNRSSPNWNFLQQQVTSGCLWQAGRRCLWIWLWNRCSPNWNFLQQQVTSGCLWQA